jgi:uncharacterized membrane protein (DUF106 family)
VTEEIVDAEAMRRYQEMSALRRKMRAMERVGNDRSYIGVAVTRAVIEG